MKWLAPALVLIAFACSCKNNNSKNIQQPAKAVHAYNGKALFKYGNPVLLQYDQFVNQLLDTDDVRSGYKAAQELQKLFKNQPPAVCDTAVYIFNIFQDWLLGSLNAQLEKDTATNYDDLVEFEGREDKPVLSKKQKALAQAFAKNGFRVWSSEGIPFLQRNEYFAVKQFSNMVTPAMKQYLAQMAKEQKEGFEEDAGLEITPEQLADRAVWWEQFNKANPNFIYKGEAASNYRIIMYALMNGTDNTSISDDQKTDSLSDYFNTAYSYMQSKYPQSQTNVVVGPYFNAWKQKDTARVTALLAKFAEENQQGQ